MDVLDRLAALIETRRTDGPRLLVGVDGPDAAGKTTLVATLAARLAPTVITASVDAFHNLRGVRYVRGRLSGVGTYEDTFNNEVVRGELLDAFRTGGSSVRVASSDYDSDEERHVFTAVPDRAVLLVDGVYLQRPELRSGWDLLIYLDISAGVSIERGVARDTGPVLSAEDATLLYERRYLPAQQIYLDRCDPIAGADVVIDNTDLSAARIVRWPSEGSVDQAIRPSSRNLS